MNASTFIIIPTYNEGSVIRLTVEPLIRDGYSVVIVDDYSQDNTFAALQELPVYYLKHQINLGQGAALQTGMTFALGRGAEIIVHFDADGQHRAEDIPNLTAPILAQQADVVLGSRFLARRDSEAVPFIKQIVLRTGVVVNWLMTGVLLTDAHNGFRALSRYAAESIYIHENRFAHASDILIQFRQQRLRYLEVPTNIRYTEYSKAKGQPVLNAFNIVIDVLLRRVFH